MNKSLLKELINLLQDNVYEWACLDGGDELTGRNQVMLTKLRIEWRVEYPGEEVP